MTVQTRPLPVRAASMSVSVVDARRIGEVLTATDASRLHFGSEFCETLLPTSAQLERALAAATDAGLELSLATPMLSDHGMAQLRGLLPQLPEGSEVVGNDWGTLAMLRRDFPRLVPVAGRLLCKMVKDPRLPTAEWARLYPHGVHSAPFRRLLAGLGVRRIELDVPPFATDTDFRSPDMAVSVHAPYGYSVKGRACRIGSLHQPDAEKFMTGHACRKECLHYVATLSRPETGSADLETFQRGNTVFYRHSPAMTAAVQAAVDQGWIDRIVVSGDWNEDRRTRQ